MTMENVRKLDPIPVIGIVGIHALALLAFYYVSTSAVVLCVVLAWLSGWVGIALCFHRLLTHRSFKTQKWFEYFLTIMGTLAWQGSPVKWVGTHRLHHKWSDTDHDPHTPNHGFWWAHVLWLFYKDDRRREAVAAAGDLARDKGLALIDRFFWVPQAFLTILLFGGGMIVGGLDEALSWVGWGIGVRTVFVYHSTWFVNSAAHTWGYKNPKAHDNSRNLWWVALFGAGEGYHSNHHADPSCAAHGIKWWEFDPTYRTIQLLACVGLASDIVRPSKDD